MKTYTLEELQELYNDLKLRWSSISVKEFLEVLELREKDRKEKEE